MTENTPEPAVAKEASKVQEQLMQAFYFRHATKLFDVNRKIPEDEFNTLLEAARLSPSSFGFEPWRLLVIQDPAKRELFRDFSWGANGSVHGSPGQLGTASHFCIFLSFTRELLHPGSEYLLRHLKEVKQAPDEVIAFYNKAFQKFLDHDFKIFSEREFTEWTARQTYIALANMLTSAAMMGIDSCPIEGFEIDPTIEVLEKHFGIDPRLYRPAVMAAFGYRAAEPTRPKTRRPMSEVVDWF